MVLMKFMFALRCGTLLRHFKSKHVRVSIWDAESLRENKLKLLSAGFRKITFTLHADNQVTMAGGSKRLVTLDVPCSRSDACEYVMTLRYHKEKWELSLPRELQEEGHIHYLTVRTVFDECIVALMAHLHSEPYFSKLMSVGKKKNSWMMAGN